jgi:hypothetical protein
MRSCPRATDVENAVTIVTTVRRAAFTCPTRTLNIPAPTHGPSVHETKYDPASKVTSGCLAQTPETIGVIGNTGSGSIACAARGALATKATAIAHPRLRR